MVQRRNVAVVSNDTLAGAAIALADIDVKGPRFDND
jgi:hypothetical protein